MESSTPIEMITLEPIARCAITIEGRIKDC
jgi:hypothetical protein